MPDRSNTVPLSLGVIKFPLAHYVRTYLAFQEYLMGEHKIGICIIHKSKKKNLFYQLDNYQLTVSISEQKSLL